jgi:hypothetical protein
MRSGGHTGHATKLAELWRGKKMKKLGIVLLAIGTLLAVIAYNTDTTVSTGIVSGPRIYNMGLMDDRRNNLLIAALLVVVGTIFFAVDNIKKPSKPAQPLGDSMQKVDTRKCPFCAEFVKIEATICRFCQKDLPPISYPAENTDIENTVTFENRVLCSDGSCIGVIGKDGNCNDCGKPYKTDNSLNEPDCEPHDSSIICPKCGYQRTESDNNIPEYECPKCGVIYAKVKQGGKNQ